MCFFIRWVFLVSDDPGRALLARRVGKLGSKLPDDAG
jgi:hypothetical protein